MLLKAMVRLSPTKLLKFSLLLAPSFAGRPDTEGIPMKPEPSLERVGAMRGGAGVDELNLPVLRSLPGNMG